MYPDKKRLVRDADVKMRIGLPASLVVVRPKGNSRQLTSVVLRRDVRRLVVLVPVEDQRLRTHLKTKSSRSLKELKREVSKNY